MDELPIEPIVAPFAATLTPPGSKSLTNRALVLAALARGRSRLSNVLLADDTEVMLEGLARLGYILDIDRGARVVSVEGAAGAVPAAAADLFCGNSGTTLRFLTALCALGHGTYVLDGVARMRERPIRELVALLRALGVQIEYLGADGFPPLRVRAAGLSGGTVRFGAAASSQYLSALLLAAPCARDPIRIELMPPQTSWPYVAMTIHLMRRFGARIEMASDSGAPSPTADSSVSSSASALVALPGTPDVELARPPRTLLVHPGAYAATEYVVEPDASNATYFLAAAAISPGSRVTIAGLGEHSLQGDVGFARVLERMGAAVTVTGDAITVMGSDRLTGIDVDLSSMPDTAQTLGVVALFAEGPTTIRGLHTLRVKETDRIAALQTELSKLGAEVTVTGDDLTIHPPARLSPATVDTYDDHRMAMSFAVAGTRSPGVRIRNPACVHKTYPEFFADLGRLGRATGSAPRRVP